MRKAGVFLLVSVGCAAGGASNGGGKPDSSAPEACLAGEVAPTTRVRRLTKAEIQTAASLLLDDSARQALDNLEDDSRINGRYSNDDQAVVTVSFLSGLNIAVDAIGTNFEQVFTSAAYDGACFASDDAAKTCAQAFIRSFGKHAYRRTLTDDDVSRLLPVYEAGREVGVDGDVIDRFAKGLSWVVRAMLQAPDFVYLTELGDPAAPNGAITRLLADEIASALSFSVVGMPPDEALVTAAAEDRLGTSEEREAQAARLVESYPDGWRQQMRTFVSEWLGINFEKPEWAKDPAAAPLYNPALKAAIETETTLFIDDWATLPGGARIDELLTGSSGFVNELNAPLYGLSISGTAFEKVSLDGTERAGILTSTGFLGSTSHANETSPVMRGKAILERLLCREPPRPPPNVPPLPPLDSVAPATTRARYEQHLVDGACRGCHELFDPMGNAFEAYDVLGAYRTTENGFPVDTTGALVAADGSETPVANAVELVKRLAADPEVRACIARQVFRFASSRQETAYDACTLEPAIRAATTSGDLREVVASIVASDAFVTRQVMK